MQEEDRKESMWCAYGSEADEMVLKAVVHEAEEGGYWAEVPAIPGCATQGETLQELRENLLEAIEGCLSVGIPEQDLCTSDQIIEIAV